MEKCKEACWPQLDSHTGDCPNNPVHQPQVKDLWRENILSTVAITMGYVGIEEYEQIPQAIVNAIDAAYVAGMDNKAEEIRKAEESAMLRQRNYDQKLIDSARKEGAMSVIKEIPDMFDHPNADDGIYDLEPLKQQLTSRFGKEE